MIDYSDIIHKYLHCYITYYTLNQKDSDEDSQYYTSLRHNYSNYFDDFNSISEDLLDLKKIGVTDISDFITYVITSRLPHIISKSKITDRKKIVTNLLKLINFLLYTHIFGPNDKIDKHPINGISYSDYHKRLRKDLTIYIVDNFISKLNPALVCKIFEPQKSPKISSLLGINCNSKKEVTINNKSISLKDLKDDELEILTDFFCPIKTPGILIKNLGLATELLAYILLLKQEIGYVLPLLLHQKLFNNLSFLKNDKFNASNNDFLTMTDFIVIGNHGRTVFLELGREKDFIPTNISMNTGIPGGTIDLILNTNQKLGYKCPVCFHPFTLCKRFIETIIDQDIKMPTNCEFCDHNNECKDKAIKKKIKIKNNDEDHYIHQSCWNESLGEVADSPIPIYPILKGTENIQKWI